MEAIKSLVGVTLFVPLMILYMFGGIIGAIMAVVNESAINVLLSLIIPFWGAGYTVISILS